MTKVLDFLVSISVITEVRKGEIQKALKSTFVASTNKNGLPGKSFII